MLSLSLKKRCDVRYSNTEIRSKSENYYKYTAKYYDILKADRKFQIKKQANYLCGSML